MTDPATLSRKLTSLDRKSYPAYKAVQGAYAFPDFSLCFDHVQGDPFADPSRVTIRISAARSDLPREAFSTAARRVAAADYLNRRLAEELGRHSHAIGSGGGGTLSILEPGQEVLRRTSVTVDADGSIEARFRIGLPAAGRSILGKAAAELVCVAAPEAIAAALFQPGLKVPDLLAHADALEDAHALRAALEPRGLVAFVADGAILPRASGVDDHPLAGAGVIPFRSPEPLRVTLDTPNGGPVSGMGIPEGVTLLVGGGFHGKSTLLRAIQRGIYDHLPGDGRERVVTRADAVKVRAEDGRAVHGTDISNFIGGLPGGGSTRCFRTANASGSTSQAAAIVEALELGSRCLLLDEDTSATNFLIRDARVQQLIAAEDEPITPLIDRLGDLRGAGVSLVLVVGGSGDYFDVADTVIAMRDYLPRVVTDQVREVVTRLPSQRLAERTPWTPVAPRAADPSRIDPRRGRRDVAVKAYGAHRLAFGTEEVDLSALEQIVESGQTRAMAMTLAWARDRYLDGTHTVHDALRAAVERLEQEGLDLIDQRAVGEYAEFRVFELGGLLNRLRGGG